MLPVFERSTRHSTQPMMTIDIFRSAVWQVCPTRWWSTTTFSCRTTGCFSMVKCRWRRSSLTRSVYGNDWAVSRLWCVKLMNSWVLLNSSPRRTGLAVSHIFEKRSMKCRFTQRCCALVLRQRLRMLGRLTRASFTLTSYSPTRPNIRERRSSG